MIAPFTDAQTHDALALLHGARAARTDPVGSEDAVKRALDLAPDDFTIRLAAYKFYFYNHRLGEALPHAEIILNLLARRLNIAQDWAAVVPEDAAFDELDEAPSLYLQALLAWGYCKARLGAFEHGARAIAKVAELNPRDRFGAHRLLVVIENGTLAEED